MHYFKVAVKYDDATEDSMTENFKVEEFSAWSKDSGFLIFYKIIPHDRVSIKGADLIIPAHRVQWIRPIGEKKIESSNYSSRSEYYVIGSFPTDEMRPNELVYRTTNENIDQLVSEIMNMGYARVGVTKLLTEMAGGKIVYEAD